MQATNIIEGRTQRATKHFTRKTGKTITVTWSKYPQYEYEHRDEVREGELTISIDIEALLRDLGTKALRSKGRKSVECSGAVVCTATKVRVVEPGQWEVK
jgi:hypothetical protein